MSSTAALTAKFLAIYLISQARTEQSSLALKRQLEVRCPSAWLLRHKINNAAAQRDSAHHLSGAVQHAEAGLGRERAGGKTGRGYVNKEPFVTPIRERLAVPPCLTAMGS